MRNSIYFNNKIISSLHNLIYREDYNWDSIEKLVICHIDVIRSKLRDSKYYLYGDNSEESFRSVLDDFDFYLFRNIRDKDCLKKILILFKYNVINFLEEDFLFYGIQWGCHKDLLMVRELLWHFSTILSYPEFYKVWHSQPEIIHPEILEISPLGNTNITQTLNQQILDLPAQLQPTEKTYPIVINAQSLEDETDNDSIAQELCNQIYAIAFPNETDIPEINNAPQ